MPNIIQLPNDFASANVYARMKQAAQKIGEQVIAFSMYHANRDGDTQPKCPACTNTIYSTQQHDCKYCYGTTYAGGVKEVWRVWAIVTDDDNNETLGKQGTWSEENHTIQTEPYPNLYKNDFIRRVNCWDTSGQIPLELGLCYQISNDVLDMSVRSGSRFASASPDRVAQKFEIKMIPPSEPIYQFPISLTKPFPRYDGQIR